MLLRLEAIQKSFGERLLFDSVDWVINAGERAALVGPNGSGKTTLLQLMIGKLSPDGGRVISKKNLSIACVEQSELQSGPSSHLTVLSQALSVFDPLMRMEHRILDLQKEMSEHPDRAGKLSDEYAHLIERFRFQGGYRFRSETEKVLQGLGFSREAMHWLLAHLSGGQQSRLKLAQALLLEPELLLLDEPTNHLDIDAIEWLESYLKDIKSTIIVVSHDRYFLDQVAQKTVEIHNRRLRQFSGNYSFYRQERDLLDRQQASTFRRQRQHIEKTEEFIRRNIAGQKTKQAKSRRKMLEKLERVEDVQAVDAMRLDFREAPGSTHEIVRCKALAIGYDTTPLIERIDLIAHRGARFGILGGNGTGKTTLLKTLMGVIPPVSGRLLRSDGLSWSYFSQTQENLNPENNILDEIHEVSPHSTEGQLRNYLACFLFRGDDVFKKIGKLSGGEKSRVALAKLLLHPTHVLLLDEPTNHLDIPAREVLETALREFTGTMFVVSHDRYFLDQLETEILFVHDRRLQKFSDLESFEARHEVQREEAVSGEAIPRPSTDSRTAKSPASVPSGPKNERSKNERMRLQEQLLALEERIHRLEAQRDKISVEMQQQEPRNFQKINELANQYEAIDLELSSIYNDWEMLMMQGE
ncbi:MAG TPA: ABC-F family ATP-binding cassette domain-containing protein [Acidobacteriota bacterium]|jgi:ATP-binding cassette subfamily F protein 3|nr:ABC-F family ATP-binding cassette domain-containing protein [Acidobacteriota bacterium]